MTQNELEMNKLYESLDELKKNYQVLKKKSDNQNELLDNNISEIYSLKKEIIEFKEITNFTEFHRNQLFSHFAYFHIPS